MVYRSFITALEEKWKVEDEGEITDLLGIEFTREGKTIELNQTKYIEKLAAEFFPDGVPSSAQQNKVPCDRDLPAEVTTPPASPDLHQASRHWQAKETSWSTSSTPPASASFSSLRTRASCWRG